MNLRDKAEEFRRIQALYARARSHRERVAYRQALEELMWRRETGLPLAPPTINRDPVPPIEPDEAGKQALEQAVRDLLFRVHRRGPLPKPVESTDHWSPLPVVAYRMWHVHKSALVGARTAWKTPTKEAVCLKREAPSDLPVPHDASVCFPPPCGIYAAKEPEPIGGTVEPLIARGSPVAIGCVALSGRVIEHEHGYRAERATVTRIGIIRNHPAGTASATLLESPADIAFAFGHIGSIHRADTEGPAELVLRSVLDFVRMQAA